MDDFNLPRGPLAAYLGVRSANQRAGLMDTQNAQGLMGILAQAQRMKQIQQDDMAQQEVKGILAQSGGDPAKAVSALLQNGNVRGAALLSPLLKQQQEDYTLSPGALRLRGGQVIAENPVQPRPAAPSELSRLIAERNALAPDDPNRSAFDSAINRASNPQQSQPEIIRLQSYLEQLPENHPGRAAIQARIRQITTHQPAVNVYSQSLTPGVDANGNPVFAQASGRPDVPPRIVPGVFPQERADVAKSRKEGEQAATTVASVRDRIERMSKLIQGGSITGGVVGPLGVAGRAVETAQGVIQPGAATPAIDFQNELRFLQSEVRKMVEKDPNLSKDEREALYETLGGGLLQTPGSSLRAMNNVLSKVENTALTGRSRAAGLESAVRNAGWTYEPSKYDYRIVNGEVQRKPK